MRSQKRKSVGCRNPTVQYFFSKGMIQCLPVGLLAISLFFNSSILWSQEQKAEKFRKKYHEIETIYHTNIFQAKTDQEKLELGESRRISLRDLVQKVDAGLVVIESEEEQLQLAFCFEILEDRDRSLQALAQILDENPEQRQAIFSKARILVGALSPQEAMTYLEKVRSRFPKNGELCVLEAIVGHRLQREGEYAFASEAYWRYLDGRIDKGRESVDALLPIDWALTNFVTTKVCTDGLKGLAKCFETLQSKASRSQSMIYQDHPDQSKDAGLADLAWIRLESLKISLAQVAGLETGTKVDHSFYLSKISAGFPYWHNTIKEAVKRNLSKTAIEIIESGHKLSEEWRNALSDLFDFDEESFNGLNRMAELAEDLQRLNGHSLNTVTWSHDVHGTLENALNHGRKVVVCISPLRGKHDLDVIEGFLEKVDGFELEECDCLLVFVVSKDTKIDRMNPRRMTPKKFKRVQEFISDESEFAGLVEQLVKRRVDSEPLETMMWIGLEGCEKKVGASAIGSGVVTQAKLIAFLKLGSEFNDLD